MLTPFQALLSAVLTGLIVQYITIKFEKLETPSEILSKPQIVLDRTIPKTLLLPTSSPEDEPSVKVDKLLDAIFVSHGVKAEIAEIEEESNVIKREIIILNESNFVSVYSGDCHVPWYPSSKSYLNHFISKFPSIPPSPLKLAVLDCHEFPFLAAALNVRDYPSLHLVTLSGRLREWPFELNPIDQETLLFLKNGHWKHLPVYQLVKPIDDKQLLFVSFIQIKAFNTLLSSVMQIQPKIFNWILNNRQLTGGILSCLSLTTLLITRKIQ